MFDTPATPPTDLDSVDYSILDDLLETKKNLKSKYGNVIFRKLYELIVEHSKFKITSAPRLELVESSAANYYFILDSDFIKTEYKRTGTVPAKEMQTLKREYISSVVIDPFTSWLYSLVSNDVDISAELDTLRNSYPNISIKNFVLPTLFSLTIGKDNDVVFLSYKLV